MTAAENDLTKSSIGWRMMVKTLLLVGRTIFQRKAYFNIVMIVCGLPRVLQNLRIASLTNHRKAAKDIHNGDMFFLATDNDLLR